MNPVLEKLGKILSLEEQTGLQNQAVIGGLDKLAEHWMREAAAEPLPPRCRSPDLNWGPHHFQ